MRVQRNSSEERGSPFPVCIGSLWLFENLDAREIAALAEAAVRRTYEEGESIFSQGDNVDRLFLVKAGLVKLSKVMEDGTEITLDMRKSGDFLGENMLGEDVEYPVSAICLEQTLICGFMKERFEHLVLSYPRIGLQVMKNLSKQISWLTHRVESMSLTGLEKRLYQTLLNIALEHGTKAGDGFIIRFPLTHEGSRISGGRSSRQCDQGHEGASESGHGRATGEDSLSEDTRDMKS